jgi:hypothetical protein
MKESNDDNALKLIYVLKIGYNSKYEGIYEFIFSTDETHIDIEAWCWDLIPACQNAQPPTEEYVSKIINLKTNKFNLFCLHEDTSRPYMHGYHTIHALAYETDEGGPTDDNGFDQFDEILGEQEELPLLVFHYGMTLTKVKELLNARKIILKNNEFIESSSIKFE